MIIRRRYVELAVMAAVLAVIGIGGGWIAAYEADRMARLQWVERARGDSQSLTGTLRDSISHAARDFYAFSRGVPTLGDGRTFDSPERPGSAPRWLETVRHDFGEDAKRVGLFKANAGYRAVSFAEWVPVGVKDDSPAPDPSHQTYPDGESFVVRITAGDSRLLREGVNLSRHAELGEVAANGFRSLHFVTNGKTVGSGQLRLLPFAVRSEMLGKEGLLLGVFDFTALLESFDRNHIPNGLELTVTERHAEGQAGAVPVYRTRGARPESENAQQDGPGRMLADTSIARGSVSWRLSWRLDPDYRGGPSYHFGTALRYGSIAAVLIPLSGLGGFLYLRWRRESFNAGSQTVADAMRFMTDAFSVVDANLTLVACNERFYDLYHLPTRFRERPIRLQELVRYRIDRGDFGTVANRDEFVRQRLARLKDLMENRGSGQSQEVLPGGRFVDIRRSLTPDGNVLTLYVDATERVRSERLRESNTALMREILDGMSDGVAVVAKDGELAYWNQGFLDVFRLSEDDAQTALSAQELFTGIFEKGGAGDSKAALKSSMDVMTRVADGRGEPHTIYLTDDRAVRAVHRRTMSGATVCTFTDITELKRAERALRQSEERYSLAAAGSSDGLWDWDLVTDEVYYSPRWREMLGLGPDREDASLDAWFSRVHPRDQDNLDIQLKEHLEHGTAHFEAEYRMLHSDDHYIWVASRGIAIRDEDGKAVRLVGATSDISERKRVEDKLIHDALYDSVTSLPNRALFLDRIGQVIRRTPSRSEDGFAVLFLDLDRFKVINDSLGHDVGDELLIDVARRLESAVQPGDSVARLASDEFGVLLANTKSREAVIEMVKWLQSDLAAAFFLREQEIFTSVCIGVAFPSEDMTSAEDLLRAADIAMYRAKDKGQGSYAVFDPQMQTRAIRQLRIESDLRRAIEREEIQVHYQPIVDFQTGRLAGLEALARWEHPEQGMVPPGQFIPLAEENGLIGPLGILALRQSCRQMVEWRRDYMENAPTTVSVNLSGRQLQDPNLVSDLELILQQEKLPGHCLKMEVTESMIMYNPEQTTRIFNEMKELGVALSIDDFGTGYSSLSYLHRFAFDTLKIDRSFVNAMHDKVENMEIIKTIALLAHNLGMDVTAEGVENTAQLSSLVDLNCEYGQGFFFEKAVPASAITKLLAENYRWNISKLISEAAE